MQFDVYVAGPFFNEAHLESMDRLESVLKKHGFKMFRPRLDSINLGKNSSSEDRKKAFEDDILAIHNSRFIVSNTMDKDMGTVFETGYAYCYGVPIVGFVEGLPKGAPFNVMLAGSMEAVFTSAQELDDFIESKGGREGFLNWIDFEEKEEYEGSVE